MSGSDMAGCTEHTGTFVTADDRLAVTTGKGREAKAQLIGSQLAELAALPSFEISASAPSHAELFLALV